MKLITNARVLSTCAFVAISLTGGCDIIEGHWPSGDGAGPPPGEDDGPEVDPEDCTDDEGGHEEPPPECLSPDPCAEFEGLGHLEGYKCDLDLMWADDPAISCEDALTACEDHAADFPGHSYLCDWNGQQIFASELVEGACDDQGPALEECMEHDPPDDPPPPPCEDVDPCAGTEGQEAHYYFDYCDMEGGSGFTAYISCQDALDNCLLNDTSNPGLSIYCEWDGIVIHRNDLGADVCVPEYGEPADCGAPEPLTCELDDPCAGSDGYLGFGVAYVGCTPYADELSGPGYSAITCEQAQIMCADIAAANPGQSLYCQWNDLALLLDEAVPGDCSAFDPC